MKSLLSVALLALAFNASAEIVTANIPKAGTFMVTVTKPSSCTGGTMNLVATNIDLDKKGNVIITSQVQFINDARPRLDACFGGDYKAIGVIVADSKSVLKINLSSTGGMMTNPKITVKKIQ